jgi:diguanylate cyclase (GGDEF)-like protein
MALACVGVPQEAGGNAAPGASSVQPARLFWRPHGGQVAHKKASTSLPVELSLAVEESCVALRVQALVSADELAPKYRWLLASTLFMQTSSLIGGSLALTAVMGACLVRTHWTGFSVLMVVSGLLMAARLAQARGFQTQTAPVIGAATGAEAGAAVASIESWQVWEKRWPRGPDVWARQFAWGVLVISCLWGATDLSVYLLFDDPLMQLFVITVQAGWVSAGSVRNAASPAAINAQLYLTLLPTIAGAALSHTPFIQILVPFLLVQLGATLNIARYTGRRIALMMLSEQRLETANARLTELSATDGLTGIGNRRAFDATLQTEWGRAVRDASELGLLMIDVDYFKLFNDRYGHPAGDDCLRLVAEVTGRTLRRPPDFVARFGGEEFVALLPGTGQAGAREVAERARQAMREAGVLHEGSPFGCVTISIGLVSMAPQPGGDPQQLIDLADRALYAAKQSGRDRVWTAGEQMKLGIWGERVVSGDPAGDGGTGLIPVASVL